MKIYSNIEINSKSYFHFITITIKKIVKIYKTEKQQYLPFLYSVRACT